MPLNVKAILFDFVGYLMEPDHQVINPSIVEAVDSLIGNVVDDAQFQRFIQNKYRVSDSEFALILNQIVDKHRSCEEVWK